MGWHWKYCSFPGEFRYWVKAEATRKRNNKITAVGSLDRARAGSCIVQSRLNLTGCWLGYNVYDTSRLVDLLKWNIEIIDISHFRWIVFLLPSFDDEGKWWLEINQTMKVGNFAAWRLNVIYIWCQLDQFWMQTMYCW